MISNNLLILLFEEPLLCSSSILRKYDLFMEKHFT